MRRITVMLMVIAALLTGCASANQWGAEGELQTFLLRSGKYDDCTYVDHNYTGPDQQRVAMVISTEMNSRLVILERDASGTLTETGCYPQAVSLTFPGYGDRWDMQRLPDDGFSMTRINGGEAYEQMTFVWQDGQPVLQFARLTHLTYSDGMTFTLTEGGYEASDGRQSVLWQVPPIPAAQFQLGFIGMPANLAEVWEDNLIRAQLPDLSWLGQGTTVDLKIKKQPAVYAAPTVKALRGGKGKAAVSLREPFTVLAVTPDEQWWLVYYDISETQRRIGYIQAPADAPDGTKVIGDEGAALQSSRTTGLMDDPWYSGGALGSLKPGDGLTVLGWTDAFYAYAEAESGGKRMRGFIALDRLTPPVSLRQKDAECQLNGTWQTGESDWEVPLSLTFDPDGLCIRDEESRTYEVYGNDPAIPGPWEGSSHVLVLRKSNGFTECFGLLLEQGRIRLSRGGEEAWYQMQ